MHRSRSREKYRRASVSRPNSSSAGSTLAEGNAHYKSRIKLLNTEHDSNCECGSAEEKNSITLEFERSHSKKSSGMPIKALINEEMSRKKPTRQSSPSLIARLMGLEALPSPGASKPLKEMRSSSKKVLYNDFNEKIPTQEDCSLKSNNDEHQEFKDVFEVVQVPKVEKQKDRIVKKGLASLRQHKMDNVFVQSFIDATSLSTDGMRRRCKELVDEEDLDHNMDIYLPFLQEPSKQFHCLTPSPSPPHAIYSSILKASKGSPTASCQSSFGSEKNVERCTNLQRGDSQSSRKFAANSYSRPSREYMCSLLKKLSESTYAEKDEYSAHPTQIVILKPTLDKAPKAERTIPLSNSLNNLQCSLTNDFKFPVHEIMELYNEERARLKLYYTAEIMGRKIKGSREVSKEVTNQLKSTSASERKKVSVANLNDYVKDEGSCTTSSFMNGSNSQTSLLTSNLYAYSHNSHSSSFPSESSVTKEARKRLSERWKLTNRFQEMDFSNRASSTLAEMLALSDNETPKMTLDTIAVKKAPERKFVRENFLEHRNHPLGISSKDGWKDNFSRSLPRSKSLPASSLIRENSQLNSKKRPVKSVSRIMHKKVEDMSNWMSLDDDFIRQKNTSQRNLKYVSNKDKHHSDGEENTLLEREIHVSSEKLKINNDLRHLSENQNTAIVLPDDCIGERRDMADNLSVSQSNTDNSSLTDRENGFEKLQDFTKSEKNVKLSECDKHELAPKEASINHVGDQASAAPCNKSGSVCPGSYKEADQPSPVSVLEAPFEEEEFSTDCFEKISADLHDLRMQLRLLKRESANSDAEDMEVLISGDEDAAAEPFPDYADVLQAFRDEEEREYSYILDILIDGGILKAELDGLFTASHSTEHPVSPNLFDKLEKKYKSIDSWSRSDRKLLFDLTNSILADTIKPKISWQSRMVHDGLVEEVWQAVAKRMKNVDISSVENLTGLTWTDLGDDKEVIGRQLENMLLEDLSDELLIELNHMMGLKSSL